MRRSAAGFTLLEILVALAVLAVTIGVLAPVYSATLDRRKLITAQETANLLAGSLLDSVGNDLPLADGIREGRFANGFGWRVEIAPYPSGQGQQSLAAKTVVATVTWAARKGTRSVVLSTIRLIGSE